VDAERHGLYDTARPGDDPVSLEWVRGLVDRWDRRGLPVRARAHGWQGRGEQSVGYEEFTSEALATGPTSFRGRCRCENLFFGEMTTMDLVVLTVAGRYGVAGGLTLGALILAIAGVLAIYRGTGIEQLRDQTFLLEGPGFKMSGVVSSFGVFFILAGCWFAWQAAASMPTNFKQTPDSIEFTDKGDSGPKSGDVATTEGGEEQELPGNGKAYDKTGNWVTSVGKEKVRTYDDADVTVGAKLPAAYELTPVPDVLVTKYPKLKSYRYVRIGKRIAIVDPSSRKVVRIID
jgi:hypothetical protein